MTTPTPETHTRRGITTMEKIMFGMTIFFGLGILIYGFLPEGAVRGIAMTIYTGVFAWFLFNPLGPNNKAHQQGKM